MKIRNSLLISSALLFMFSACAGHANEIKQGKHVLELSSQKVNFSIVIEEGKLVSDLLKTQPEWSHIFQNSQTSLETDADFKMEIMWTDWRAPGKANNADNLVILSKKDFELTHFEKSGNEIRLTFRCLAGELEMKMLYSLEPDDFYIRRKIALRDTVKGTHFLQKLAPICAKMSGDPEIVKEGDFGQPAALRIDTGGAFFGLEYPASQNSVHKNCCGNIFIECSQEIGECIARLVNNPGKMIFL